MADRSARSLSPDQLAEVLALSGSADGVELKVSVPDSDRRSAVAALDIDPLDAQIRQIVFLDTPELTLNQRGVVLRVRRVQGKLADSIVKLRPVVAAELPTAVRKSPNFSVEVDVMPGGFVCSATMKSRHDPVVVKETLAGHRPHHKLFSREQKDLYASHAPSGLPIQELAMLGPINVLKVKFTPADLRRRLVAELWYYPNGSRILELSTKCTPAQASAVAADTKAFLASRGIDLSAGPRTTTKTKTALRFFANELNATEGDR